MDISVNDNNMMTLPKRGLKTRSYNMNMNKKDLKRLSKSQLIKLLLKRDSINKPIPPQRTGKWENVKPKPILRKSINEELILPPPEQFQDGYKPIPKPRTDRPLQKENARRPPKPTRKPPLPPIPQVEEKEHITNVPLSKIREVNQALKGHAKSYEIELQDNLNLLNHSTKTRPPTESHLENLLKTMKGFKFMETLEVTFEKDTINSKTGKHVSIYKTAFFNGKA